IVSSEKKKKTICADYLPEWRELLLNSPYFSYSQWLEAMDAENGQAIIYAKESDEITKTLSLKPVQGEFKVTIIWLPEKMHEACANKMLKLLEEPPEHTIFLLCSEEPERILPTILSRTQRINLPRLTEAEIADALQNKYGVQPRDSETLAHLANGSFVKALDQIHLNEDNDRYLQLFMSLMRLAYARRIREMKAWSEEVAALGREKQKDLLGYCQRMIRESFMANFHQKQMSYMNLEEQNFTSRFAPFVNEKNAMDIMYELSEAQIHIEQNVNAKMVFFDLALKMIVLLIRK
ncbi:MAG: DNA polymerase III subunit delta, partial [Bacteroidaceae bacterium]|nr:DNA polymerase III subunit delta [Bacteroidaceae bacterium]